MAVWKVERLEAAQIQKALRAAVARRRKQIVTLVAGALLMAAVGGLLGSLLQLDDLEMRPVRGSYLHVLPGQGGGQTGVTIP